MANQGIGHLSTATAKILRDLAAHIWTTTRTTHPGIWIGRGYDLGAYSGQNEHAKKPPYGVGCALDVIVAPAVGVLPTTTQKVGGDVLVSWLIRGAAQLHIRHLIWDGKIWKRRYASQGWQPLSYTGGVSAMHRDHIHILLDDPAGSLPTTPITTTPTTTQEADMPLTESDISQIATRVWSAKFGAADDTAASRLARAMTAAETSASSTAPIRRVGIETGTRVTKSGTVSLRQEVADTKTVVMDLLAQVQDLKTLITKIASEEN